MLEIFVDADACPVKNEIYRVARRCGLVVRLVSNTCLRAPSNPVVKQVIVENLPDAADDWIAENIGHGDIAVTADIPLAARCLEKDARVVGPRGRVFEKETIGDALATRSLLSGLRETGAVTGGPRAIDHRDRSRFLQKLDQLVQAVRREESRRR